MKRLATTLLACTLASAAQAQAPGHITASAASSSKAPTPKPSPPGTATHSASRQSLRRAILHTDAPNHPPMALWTAFRPDDTQFAATKRDFMINFAVTIWTPSWTACTATASRCRK